jgi:6-phosphofructokinase
MNTLRGTAVVAHGGGPTAVLNASLAAILSECREHDAVQAIYGARFGATGLIEDDFLDLSRVDDEALQGLRVAPGSAIGSSRRKIEAGDYERILDVLKGLGARFLFYTGGNGSMETALHIDRFARESGYELRVVGVPKTIDNDVAETDHTPGYASCARFFAHAARDVGADNRALPPPIEILEVLGRNTGWVVAATALARQAEDDPPHLIYFPECGVSADQMCADVERIYRRFGRCMVAVCEGQTDEQGGWFGAELISMPGARDPLPANMGQVLARLLWSRTGLRTRAEKPGLVGRSCGFLVSEVDRTDSWNCGVRAVRAAIEGYSGQMVGLRRLRAGARESDTFLIPLERVARAERPFPREWMNDARNDVTLDFIEWARPLIGDVKPHIRL